MADLTRAVFFFTVASLFTVLEDYLPSLWFTNRLLWEGAAIGFFLVSLYYLWEFLSRAFSYVVGRFLVCLDRKEEPMKLALHVALRFTYWMVAANLILVVMAVSYANVHLLVFHGAVCVVVIIPTVIIHLKLKDYGERSQ